MYAVQLKKSLAALATVAAITASPLAQANSACGIYDFCYAGKITEPAKSPSFDEKIGKITLTELSDLAGDFLTMGLSFTSVSLWKNGSEVAVDSTAADGFSFDDIAAGKYNVRVTGLAEWAFSKSKVGGFYMGGLNVTPAVPEPETYALFGAGLLAVFFMSRRRNNT